MRERRISAGVTFAVLSVVAAVAILTVIYNARQRGADAPAETSLDVPTTGRAEVVMPSRLYFRHNALGPHYGKLAEVRYDGHSPVVSFIDHLSCEAAYVAGGRGICLSARRGVVTTYSAKLFDAATYQVSAELPLAGVPSRTRVSPDARYGATTVFVTGHGYDSVDFSTQTLLIDLERGESIADLETFRVFENGEEISSPDFNFWGVTFTPDSSRFYATLSTAGRHLLVHGRIADRTVEVVHENVECPSVSPDGRRVAYKRRVTVDGRVGWQLYVLDLATGRETPLAERRSVDDQLEWLDNNHVLYSVAAATSGSAATDLWLAAADGSGEPEVFLRNAYSPAAIRY